MKGGAAAGKPAFELEYLPDLAELLRSGDFALRSSVFGCLELLGPKAAPAVPDLLPLTLEKREGNIDWAAAAEQVINVSTGTDQTVYRYWHTIMVDDSQPAEKIERAKEQIKNWEEANKRREEDLKRFNQQQAGGLPGPALPQSDPRGR